MEALEFEYGGIGCCMKVHDLKTMLHHIVLWDDGLVDGLLAKEGMQRLVQYHT